MTVITLDCELCRQPITAARPGYMAEGEGGHVYPRHDYCLPPTPSRLTRWQRLVKWLVSK